MSASKNYRRSHSVAGPKGPCPGSCILGFIPIGARAEIGAYPARAQIVRLLGLGLVLAILALAAPVTADDTAPTTTTARTLRIVNGLSTTDFPTTGLLMYSASGSESTASGACSGTLIGCQTFLTAAHCVADAAEGADLDPANYFVLLQNALVAAVDSMAVHPDYATVSGATVTFGDELADIAVLKLAQPVMGISPQPLLTTDPFTIFGSGTTSGTIAGFGITEGTADDLGIKRWGQVAAEGCPASISSETVGEKVLCWDFANPLGSAGEDSNTCNGDSGGPLFFTVEGTEVVAGVTQAGINASCLPEASADMSWDTSVYHYLSFVQTQLALDSTSACGNLPPVGSSGTSVTPYEGSLVPSGSTTKSFEVPSGTQELRIVMNGIDGDAFDPDLRVRYGLPPTSVSSDCLQEQYHPYGSCAFENPTAGTWYAQVENLGSSTGTYQLTVTQMPEPVASAAALAVLLTLMARGVRHRPTRR